MHRLPFVQGRHWQDYDRVKLRGPACEKGVQGGALGSGRLRAKPSCIFPEGAGEVAKRLPAWRGRSRRDHDPGHGQHTGVRQLGNQGKIVDRVLQREKRGGLQDRGRHLGQLKVPAQAVHTAEGETDQGL